LECSPSPSSQEMAPPEAELDNILRLQSGESQGKLTVSLLRRAKLVTSPNLSLCPKRCSGEMQSIAARGGGCNAEPGFKDSAEVNGRVPFRAAF